MCLTPPEFRTFQGVNQERPLIVNLRYRSRLSQSSDDSLMTLFKSAEVLALGQNSNHWVKKITNYFLLKFDLYSQFSLDFSVKALYTCARSNTFACKWALVCGWAFQTCHFTHAHAWGKVTYLHQTPVWPVRWVLNRWLQEWSLLFFFSNTWSSSF